MTDTSDPLTADLNFVILPSTQKSHPITDKNTKPNKIAEHILKLERYRRLAGMDPSLAVGWMEWQDYLLEGSFRVGCVVLVSAGLLWLNGFVAEKVWVWYGGRMMTVRWQVASILASILLLVLAVVWTLMVSFLALEAVWTWMRTPIRFRRSEYQRLFDF